MSTAAAPQVQLAAGPVASPVQDGLLQGAAINPSPVRGVPPAVHEVLRSPGQPLDSETCAFMEPSFGHDFSGVRVHADGKGAESARMVNALAYTVGGEVVFGAGQYAPNTAAGRRLVAHELTHVVQQSHGAEPVGHPLEVQHNESAEAEAEAAADFKGQIPISVRSWSPLTIARQPMDPRHARGYGGEQSMGFGYSQEKGWILIEGPSGSAGHGVTTKGFDGVAYNATADELHLIDNKSLKATSVSSATAISKNLEKNLDTLIQKVEGIKDMPNKPRILQLLKEMRTNLANGKKIPKNTKLIVTGEGGQAKRVSSTLHDQGVEFREPGTTDLPPVGQATPKPAIAPATSEPEPAVPARKTGQTPTAPKAPVSPENEPAVTPKPAPAAPKTPGTPTPPVTEAPPVVKPTTPPVVTPPARPPSAWKAGLKAGGKTLIVALIFAGLEYWVHRQLEKDLEEDIDKSRKGALSWAKWEKSKDPSKPVYMSVKVESKEYSTYIPLLGWMPDSPVLRMLGIAMVREEINPPIVEMHDNRLNVWHPGVTTIVTYTEPMVP